jgi:hypothetical protein
VNLTKAIRIENVDMSNEKGGVKPPGRKPKGSNKKSRSSWVSAVPNGELKGEARWGRTGLRSGLEVGCRKGVDGETEDTEENRANGSSRWP